jgi:hypothetical protein
MKEDDNVQLPSGPLLSGASAADAAGGVAAVAAVRVKIRVEIKESPCAG